MQGILFKPDMIKAIVEGRKTQTRRLSGLKEINQEPDKWRLIYSPVPNKPDYFEQGKTGKFIFCEFEHFTEKRVRPHYQVGKVVYIKEAWVEPFNRTTDKDSETPLYKADIDPSFQHSYKWHTPLFMPAWAARYFIQFTDVRAERLQEISLSDIYDEGGDVIPSYDRIDAYKRLWDSINPKYPWAMNPWVWRYEFKKVKKCSG